MSDKDFTKEELREAISDFYSIWEEIQCNARSHLEKELYENRSDIEKSSEYILGNILGQMEEADSRFLRILARGYLGDEIPFRADTLDRIGVQAPELKEMKKKHLGDWDWVRYVPTSKGWEPLEEDIDMLED